MKNFILTFFVLFSLRCVAQIPKYGNVTAKEISSNTCDMDPEAKGMYLYQTRSSFFTDNIENEGLILETNYKARIKILSEEGKDLATQTISYYYKQDGKRADNASLSKISAAAYNLVNGKVVKTEMDDKYVFHEQTSNNRRTTKFTIPDVKVGTVIEFKYTLRTPRYWDIPTWYAQRTIPVLKAHCDIDVPEFLRFFYEEKGYISLHPERKDKANVYHDYPGYSVDINAENIPAIKEETYAHKYASRIEFELSQIVIPGRINKEFSTTWDAVRTHYLDNLKYKEYLNCKNPFAEEMAQLDLEGKTNIEKADAIFAFVKNKIKWDGKYYNSIEKTPTRAAKEGKGNNLEINFILISMLRNANVPATAMLVKSRDNGPLSYFATLDQFDTSIVAFADEQGNILFLDGSSEYGGINAIPLQLLGTGMLLETGIVVNPLDRYDLSELGSNDSFQIQSVITPEGELQTSRKATYSGLSAMLMKEYFNSKDSTEYVKGLFNDENINIVKLNNQYSKGTGSIYKENIRFTTKASGNADLIYVNPLVAPCENNNPYTSETRTYPVEFPFLSTEKAHSIIIIPDGYEVDELPKSETITTPDGTLSASISFSVVENAIVTQYVSNISTTIVTPTDYAALREYWAKLIDINNKSVVIKKKKAQ